MKKPINFPPSILPQETWGQQP